MKIETIISLVSIVLFVVIYLLLRLGFGQEKRRKLPAIKKRKSIYRTLDLKTLIYILLASAVATAFINTISFSPITTSLVYITLIGLAPLALSNNLKRIHQEKVFQDVVLYCQNMGMLLKQYHNVYYALKTVSVDLKTELKEDVESLIKVINLGKELTYVKSQMDVMQSNYNYTCITNLNTIMLHMQFENANIDDTLLETYQDDVEELSKNVRLNKSARNAMRIQYIGISLGCIAIYKFFINSMKDSLLDQLNSASFNVVNTIFIFGVIFSLFFIDRYFNSKITKE